MTLKRLLLTLPFLLAPIALLGQGRGVTPAELLKPLADDWPTYNGDYSGKRYSALTQINRKNVMNLTLAWTTRLTPGSATTGGGFGGGRGGGGGAPLIIGGEGTG
ncbi:MAG: acido-empty-quinoprotein group A, partial [Acidobacteriota bacterium]|nr:acido-empty-quinoprotein group A [Acidobacteriota bacterium]